MHKELSPEMKQSHRAVAIALVFIIVVGLGFVMSTVVLPQYQEWKEFRTENPLTPELGITYQFPVGWSPVLTYGRYGANFICINEAEEYRVCVPHELPDDD